MIKTLSRFEIYGSIVFFIVFCVYFFPSFNNEMRVHDTFDGNFPIRHALIQSGHFFDLNPNSIVPGSMNGLPRGVFPRFTEITSVLMFLFGSLNGYALTFLLVRFLAFLGIYLFGRDHLNIKDDKKGLLLMIAFAYACLPFFVMHGLTVAGIPLVLWAFFNITKNQRTGMSYLVFTLFVLWSNFVLVGVHSIFLLGTLFLYFSWHNKKIQWKLLLAIMFIGTLYILSDYMLIYLHYFNKDFHSSRGEFDKFLGLNFNGVIGNSAKLFFTGDYSTANYFGYLFIPFMLFFAGAWFRNKKEENYRSGIAFLIITALFAVIISLLDWKSFSFFYEKFTFAKVFNFKRFTSVLPGLFFISALVSIIVSNKNNSAIMRINSLVLMGAMFFFIWRGNVSFNRSAFDTTGYKILNGQQTTFAQFFDPALYQRVKNEMASDTTGNIINFGCAPGPAKYAGLNVLDDYQGDYPIEYKTEFRKVIEGELNKSEKLKKYFDGWGSRCYLESANEFENKLESKEGCMYEKELAINTAQLKKMNCNYILSSIVIGNSSELKLELKKVLVSELDLKKIILYKINL